MARFYDDSLSLDLSADKNDIKIDKKNALLLAKWATIRGKTEVTS